SWARSIRRHALVLQLPHRLLVLGQVRQPPATKHVRRLGELNVVIADDLDAVPPWVEEIQKAPRQRLNASFLQGRAYRLLVIDHQCKVPAVAGRLPAALLKGEAAVTEIDEGSVFALAAQLEVEQPTVEFQRLVDVADLDRDVI